MEIKKKKSFCLSCVLLSSIYILCNHGTEFQVYIKLQKLQMEDNKSRDFKILIWKFKRKG